MSNEVSRNFHKSMNDCRGRNRKLMNIIYKIAFQKFCQIKCLFIYFQLMDIKVPAGSGGGGGGVGGNRGGDGGNRNKRASRDNRNQPQGQANDDDWSTVPSSRSNRNENFKSFDPQKLQKTRDADNISLGPTRSGWGKGSGVYAPGGSKPQNRFAAADPDRPQQVRSVVFT